METGVRPRTGSLLVITVSKHNERLLSDVGCSDTKSKVLKPLRLRHIFPRWKNPEISVVNPNKVFPNSALSGKETSPSLIIGLSRESPYKFYVFLKCLQKLEKSQ